MFGWNGDLRGAPARRVWILVLVVGVVLSALAVRPVPAIIFAQAANGLLLPVVAVFLLYLANDRKLLGARVNGWVSNLVGVGVVLVAMALGLRSVLKALGVL